MEIYVLRHGEADPLEPGHSDLNRKLTDKGKRDVRDVLRVARQAKAAPQLILTSPARRAQETAAIAAAIFQNCPVTETDRLLPFAAASSAWKESCKHSDVSRVMLVGHQPHLGHLIAFLLEGAISVDLKKAALVRIDTAARLGPPRGVLKWMITPRLARVFNGR